VTAPAEAPPDAGLDDDRAPLLPRPVLVTGLVIGLALVVLTYWGGAHPRVLAAGFPGYVAGFVLTAVVCVAVGTALAELVRRHGKRAVFASARGAGSGYRAVIGRGGQWAAPRWQGRHNPAQALAAPDGTSSTTQGGAMNKAQRVAVAIRQAWGTAPIDVEASMADNHTLNYTAFLPPGVLTVPMEQADVPRALAGAAAVLGQQLGEPVAVIGGWHTDDGVAVVLRIPASAPAPVASTGKEPAPMTAADPAPAGRRRLSEQQKDSAPAGWQAVANDAAEFEPESDEELLDWMGNEVAGMFSYGEAVVDLYETCIDGVRLDPVAMAALHDVGDAVADAAAAMAEARQKFAAHYAEIREFVAQGGVLPKDGDWITGEGDAA
jgi:hypothetical protein